MGHVCGSGVIRDRKQLAIGRLQLATNNQKADESDQ